jgi:SAM-dependent methyltransferase
LEHSVNRQAAHPRGFFGRFLGWNWIRETAAVNVGSLNLLSIEPASHVIKLGCGPGVTLREAARRASRGRVIGLDVSELMAAASRRRNRSGIREGRVEVHQADVDDLALPPNAFDRIYSVLCIYFWKDPDRVFAQLATALRPDGRLLLAFRPEPNVPVRFRDLTYRFYAPEDVIARLAPPGLSGKVCKEPDTVVWIMAERP